MWCVMWCVICICNRRKYPTLLSTMKGNWMRENETEIEQRNIFNIECLGSGFGYEFTFFKCWSRLLFIIVFLLLWWLLLLLFFRNRSQFPLKFRLVHCVVCYGIDGSASKKFTSHEIHLARIRCVIQIPKWIERSDGKGICIYMIFNWILFWWNFWYILYLHILLVYERVLTRFIYFIFFIISFINFSSRLECFKFLWLQHT